MAMRLGQKKNGVTRQGREAAWKAFREGLELADPDNGGCWDLFECPECHARLAVAVHVGGIIAERHLAGL